MKKLFLSGLFVCAGILFASAQSFEGTIEFRKITPNDTSNYVYFIKGDKIRIDDIGQHTKKVEGSFLIDLKTNKMLWVNYDRKMYGEQATGLPTASTGKFDVKKTGNVKTIQGEKCNEYVVKNADEKIQITYWMANGKFDFFFRLLKLLNRKDKSSVYIQQLTDVTGMFPFLSSQINLDTNKEEVKLEVTKIEKKTIETKTFDTPKDFAKFQN